MNTKTAISAIATGLLAIMAFGMAAHAGAPSRSEQTGAAKSGCAVLPISLLNNTFGEHFDDKPLETKSPPAYDGAWGRYCQFFSEPPFSAGHQIRVDLMVYTEASAAEAKQTFDKAAIYFADRSKPNPSGIGDAAYWGNNHDDPTIHVLKGNVHYSLGMQPTDEGRLKQLAVAVAGQL